MTSESGPPQINGAEVVVDDLCIEVRRYGKWISVVDSVSLHIEPGETIGLVGESGSGKSLTASAIMGLLPPSVQIARGDVRIDDTELRQLSRRQLNRVRGRRMAMVFQDPQNSLNPAYTIGNQLVETVRAHSDLSRKDAAERSVELLERVGITHARERLADYPHQFSGGMAQRVMIALAIAARPRFLIADEPTTALDVTVQAQILRLLQQLRDEDGMSLMLISHDLSVIAEMADRVAVMYAGQIVESGTVDEVLLRPTHPYSEALLGAQPGKASAGEVLVAIPGNMPDPAALPSGCRFHTRCAYVIGPCRERPPQLVEHGEAGTIARCIRADELSLSGVGSDDHRGQEAPGPQPRRDDVLLELRGLTKEYAVGAGVFGRSKRTIRAVDDVAIDIRRGESVGLVGESGAGKSTVGRLVLGLTPTSSGEVHFEGRDIASLSKKEQRLQRRDIQVVFQNPYASLDPLMPVEDIIAEPMDVHERPSASKRRERVEDLLAQVGLEAAYRFRYPHQLSGGQRQRVAIARALSLRPKLIVCDEPVSSLDVSTQAQVINLLKDLQRETDVAYLFVGHDLEVVRHVSDRIAVMYLGRVVESGPSEQVYRDPRHPYTRMLLSSVLSIDPTRRRLQTAAESKDRAETESSEQGCPFAPRCPSVMDECRAVDPPVTYIAESSVRCHLHSS